MKKILFFIFFTISCQISFGQMFFDFGVKGAYGPTFLFNKDIFDSGDYRHDVTYGYGFGAKFGLNFNGQHGLTLDYMKMTSKQDLLFDLGDQKDLLNAIVWKHNDFLLMYRYTGYGAYIEIGPKISLMDEVTQNIGPSGGVSEVTPFYEKSYLSGVFGFGSGLIGTDLAHLQIGIRIHFAIDDMVNEDGKVLMQPTPGFVLNNSKTLATAAMLNVEFNYAFGRLAKAQCSGRRRLILFE